MITPIKTMTISQIIARQDDLLVSVDDVKAITKSEVAKTIDEIIKTLSESEDTILSDKQFYALVGLKEQKNE